ncbi:MAG: sigma-70 family RNA polymerase sigma factor [Acidobacteriales bacterium]|nr:sigma-70 family RNA polymerase sigma factor [Terriglobales bacterium]
MIELGWKICTDMPTALGREWMETNGLGGYASSSILGANTRRYHGLLVASLHPPVLRTVLLSKFEEAVIVQGERFELSTNQYPGAIHPLGFQFLRRFRLEPFPVFTFHVGGVEIEKSVFMPHGENTVVAQYKVTDWEHGGTPVSDCRLELRPLIAFRDYHSLAQANGNVQAILNDSEGRVSIRPYSNLPALHFAHNAQTLDQEGFWYNNFEYAAERDRGLDFSEDLYSPFALHFGLSAKTPEATVVASLEPREVSQVPAMRKNEVQRRKRIMGAPPVNTRFPDLMNNAGILRVAAEQYIVARGEHETIIAGYHWFSDWGRDTMISLPGLTLSTGRYEVAKDVLETFAESVSQGMLPNRFPDFDEAPEFNTIDATLWFFHAAHQYGKRSGDRDFVLKRLYPVLQDIIEWHVKGTRHNIKVDADGLLAGGAEHQQLTWMDARIGDWVVTPRRGKPVEIQALWYNALRVMEDWSEEFGHTSDAILYRAMAEKAKTGFQEKFWNAEAGCLYDVIEFDQKDAAIRPNQIFAVSLPHPLIEGEQARKIVAVVQEQLLTPYGLRSLSPHCSGYVGKYQGGVVSRDSAYHQGTVWPWLIGPFLTAYLRVHGYSEDSRKDAAGFLRPLLEHLTEAGLGHISEVFDGDAPQHPGGCIAQAWSVAEVLRCLLDELGQEPVKSSKKSTSRKAAVVVKPWVWPCRLVTFSGAANLTCDGRGIRVFTPGIFADWLIARCPIMGCFQDSARESPESMAHWFCGQSLAVMSTAQVLFLVMGLVATSKFQPGRDEAGLIERVKQGQNEAYYELVRPYERSIYMAAYSVLQNEADAEDVAQEAVLKAFMHLKTFRAESKFSTWVIQITINEARMKLRKDRRHLYESTDAGLQDDDGQYLPKDYQDWREIPAETLERNEVRRAIANALASLSPIYREVFVLRDVQNLSIEETAEALGVTQSTVKTRLLRARLQMRDKLAPGWGAGWMEGPAKEPEKKRAHAGD